MRETCLVCGRKNWAGEMEVRLPSEIGSPWHARVVCRWCGSGQDMLRSGLLVPLDASEEPTDWMGGNPFLAIQEDE